MFAKSSPISKTSCLLSLVLVFSKSECSFNGYSNNNNVCKNLEDYATISNNANCWHEPDVNAPPQQIAKNHGFPFEIHQVASPDGFILKLFRIPHNGTNANTERVPIILHHGILLDGLTFMTLGNKSPAFVLSRRGYDVWLVNIRGTIYSRQHLKYSPFDTKYWDFSFHELGVYDIPVLIDYISKVTGQKGKITLTGYSMGATATFIYASTYPQHAKENIKSIVGIAPVIFMYNVNPVLGSLAKYRDLIVRTGAKVFDYGIGPNFPALTTLSGRICNVYPFIVLCVISINLLSGTNIGEMEAASWPLFFSHSPAGLSFKTLIHYAQFLANPEEGFHPMDYGPEKNLRMYQSQKPPAYNLSRINVPVHLFYGKNDLISTEKDVMRLYNELKTVKTVMSVFEDGKNSYTHTDFPTGANSPRLFNIIADTIEK